VSRCARKVPCRFFFFFTSPPSPPRFPPGHQATFLAWSLSLSKQMFLQCARAQWPGEKKEEENQTRFYWLSILTAESGKKNDALKKVSVCCALYSPPPKRIIAIKSMTRHALHGVSDEVLLHIDLLFSSMRMFCNYLGTCLSARFQQHAFLECILHDR